MEKNNKSCYYGTKREVPYIIYGFFYRIIPTKQLDKLIDNSGNYDKI